MSRKITLRDIAKEAGVSLSTVSQVLNNRPNVAPQTRQHVLKVAEELGYRPKVEVAHTVVPQLSTIGLLTRSTKGEEPLIANPFYSQIIAGAENECQRHGINLMYANIEVDERKHAINFPAMLLDEIVDGVIVVGAFLEETLTDISRRANSNVVLVDAYTPDDMAFDSVLIDNINGAYNAVSYLIQNGHRHIGLIGSEPDAYPSILERRLGYISALQNNGIKETYIIDSQLSRADGFSATIRLLKRYPHITAIFACNDNVAIGVMNAVRELGLNVPDDISVIGFDDIALAQEVVPPLTTMHVDTYFMGAMALRHLRDRVEHPNRPILKTHVSTQLIERGSCKRLGMNTPYAE
ncbi:MAG: hypothetical protein CUN55_13570 [Phototrophicales bacterium]|nr:MAG: hypothetical protein CUN55_13570 [Phototrophicales bacterium]